MRTFNIHPINLIKALSMALELAVTGVESHHWRVAVICDRLADELGVEMEDWYSIVYAALVHDIGAASDSLERERLRHVRRDDGPAIFRHAEEGYQLLRGSSRLGSLAAVIRYHHDRWDGKNPSGLKGEAIPLPARIIHLADQVTLRLQPKTMIFGQVDKLMHYIEEQSGYEFDPAVVEAFKRCAEKESFWLDTVNEGYRDIFFQRLDSYGVRPYSEDEVLDLADIFATIINRMSRFTASHSHSVASVAAYLAGLHGFSDSEVKMMQLAGLLHDLGKLAVPNAILEKPGRLTRQELQIVRQHSYYTYRILEQIDGFEQLAQWAGLHHECLDGSGYPFHLKAEAIPLGSRIVAVADVFVALTEERPYSGAFSRERAETIMLKMTAENKLDAGVAARLFEHYAAAVKLVR